MADAQTVPVRSVARGGPFLKERLEYSMDYMIAACSLGALLVCLAVIGMMYLAQHGAWLGKGAAAAKTGGDGDILLAIHRERHGIALHHRGKAHGPQSLAGGGLHSAEDAIIIADKGNVAVGGEHARQEG